MEPTLCGLVCRWKHPQRAKTFYQWLEVAYWQIDMRTKLRKLVGRLRNVKMHAMLNGWYQYCKDVKLDGYTNEIESTKVRCTLSPLLPAHLRSAACRLTRAVFAGGSHRV